MPVAYLNGQQQLMEVNSNTMNSEVDVNILINHYHKKLSTVVNQNVLLEAKVESITKEYMDLQQRLLKLEEDKKKEKK
tara:strand:- start:1325 stop:1558 length:234 start_codon:yes stop_codon:yes gene_type:complete